jgi:hypothetical protein
MSVRDPLAAALVAALAALDRAAAAAATAVDGDLAERLERHARDLEVELVRLSRNATSAALASRRKDGAVSITTAGRIRDDVCR